MVSHLWLPRPTPDHRRRQDVQPSPVVLPEAAGSHTAEQVEVWVQGFNGSAGIAGSDLGQVMSPLFYPIVFEFGYNLLTFTKLSF